MFRLEWGKAIFVPSIIKAGGNTTGMLTVEIGGLLKGPSSISMQLLPGSGRGESDNDLILGSDRKVVYKVCARLSWIRRRSVFFSIVEEGTDGAIYRVTTSPGGKVELTLIDERETDPQLARKWQLEMIQVAFWA